MSQVPPKQPGSPNKPNQPGASGRPQSGGQRPPNQIAPGHAAQRPGGPAAKPGSQQPVSSGQKNDAETPDGAGPLAEPIPYGQHLLPKGPQGLTKEQALRRLKPPGVISIVFSSIYLAVLLGAVGLMVLGFIAASAEIEVKRDMAGQGGSSRSSNTAKRKQEARKNAEKKAEAKIQFEKDRARLFFVFGGAIIALFTGMTTQAAGIVAGINMAGLKSFRWSWRGMLFTALPLCSILFLILSLIGADLVPMFLTMAIAYGAADFVRMAIGIWGTLAMIGKDTRKMFTYRK